MESMPILPKDFIFTLSIYKEKYIFTYTNY